MGEKLTFVTDIGALKLRIMDSIEALQSYIEILPSDSQTAQKDGIIPLGFKQKDTVLQK